MIIGKFPFLLDYHLCLTVSQRWAFAQAFNFDTIRGQTIHFCAIVTLEL